MQDPKKSPKIDIWAPSHNFVGLYLRNYGMYRQSEKYLLSSNISPTCPHNMMNFSPLAAEIVSLVWGTPGNFNGFRVLAALLHGTLVLGVSQTAALNRGRHLYSAGRPSRWALAHISSYILDFFTVARDSGRLLCFGHVIMAALRSRCGHYIFALGFLSSSFLFLA